MNDWVGRCIAESETAGSTRSVTLTYGGGDHPRAAVLTPSDIRKYLKRIRRAGWRVRFFMAGELGSAKGRAHWHGLLFFEGEAPDRLLGQRMSCPFWPHGFSFWDEPSVAAVRYVCKYIQKDRSDVERQRYFTSSRRPPIGDAFFRRLAHTYVDQRLSPQRPFYEFRDVLDRSGRPVKFQLTGRSLENFCQYFLDEWGSRVGGHAPVSDLLQEYLDRCANPVGEVPRRSWFGRGAAPWIEPPGGVPMMFSGPLNTWFCDVEGERLYWSFDHNGRRAWRGVIVTETRAEALREASTPAAYRAARDGM